MKRSLHIICCRLPWPADHASAIDIFHRIVALKNAGAEIYLHYFSNGSLPDSHPLQEYCSEINEYPLGDEKQVFGWKDIIGANCKDYTLLASNLSKDNDPILVEGIECCGMLEAIKQEDRKVIIRFQYNPFGFLQDKSINEKKIIRKIKWLQRIRRLSGWFRKLNNNYSFALMNEGDAASFREKLNHASVFVLPPFLAKDEVNCECGTGNFCLYHADLSVPENEQTAIWLLEKVFNDLPVPFVIAGRKPSRCLDRTTHLYQHACLISDPAPAALQDLVNKAHINILPTLSYPGPGLELVNAMQSGRHCIVNEKAILNSGFEQQCHIANDPKTIKATILELYHKPFESPEKHRREKIISAQYNNEKAASALVDRLWSPPS